VALSILQGMTDHPRSSSDLGSRGFWLALVIVAGAAACSSGSATGGSGGAAAGSGGSPPADGSGGTASSGSGGGSGGLPGGSGGAASAGSGGATATGSGGAAVSGSGGVAGTAGAGMTGGTAGGPGGGPGSGGGNKGTGNGSGGSSGGAGGSAGPGGTAGSAWNGTLPAFTKHTIASFASGYAMAIGDVDHDGMPDVIALSSGSAGLVWFKNPSWTKYTITTKPKSLIFPSAYDVDGDGDLDVAFISDFAMTDTSAGGTISWAENPGTPTTSQDWAVHGIGAIPTSHRVRWADLDGDGKKELIALPLFGMGSVAPAYMGAVKMTAFSIPADPKTDKWTSKVIDDTHLEVAHELTVVKLDGDKGESLITSANDGVDIYRSAAGTGTPSRVHVGDGAAGQAPNKGSSEAVLGSLAGQRFIATIEPWHGTDAVVYMLDASYQGTSRKVLGSDFEHGHGMAAGDFNGDGYDEFVGGGGQGAMVQNIYRYVPSTKAWDKIELDKGSVAVSYLDVADMNGDGAPDIVTLGTSNIVWYENMRAKTPR